MYNNVVGCADGSHCIRMSGRTLCPRCLPDYFKIIRCLLGFYVNAVRNFQFLYELRHGSAFKTFGDDRLSTDLFLHSILLYCIISCSNHINVI